MEGRSIIHKMHVLERSFLLELKYSTSLLPSLLHPRPIPSGLRLSASSTKHFPADADTNLAVVDHR